MIQKIKDFGKKIDKGIDKGNEYLDKFFNKIYITINNFLKRKK